MLAASKRYTNPANTKRRYVHACGVKHNQHNQHKLKQKTLAVERPRGRRIRTGFTNIEIKDMFDLGWACVDGETDPTTKADAANAMAALGMIFAQGERPGHLLPDAWHDERHLSRAHLLVFLTSFISFPEHGSERQTAAAGLSNVA
eukprot:COSAG06_NODE_843_length_11985_cov_10.069494_11_plen_146_part_00